MITLASKRYTIAAYNGTLDSRYPDGIAPPFFTEDFKTGYTWGTLPMTTQATAVTQMGSNWQYIDWATSHGSIEQWPPDTAKNAYAIQYVGTNDADVCQHQFTPQGSTTRPTHAFFQWKEYRSSTFDFGPSKDIRFGCYRENEYGGLGGATQLDVYFVFGNDTAAGVGACTHARMNRQGTPIYTGDPGDDNIVNSTAYVFPRATEKKVEVEIKMNSPDTADGIYRLWIDDVLIAERLDFKWYADGYTQFYIDFFQMGMEATNGGLAFEDTSKIWRTDVAIGLSRIG